MFFYTTIPWIFFSSSKCSIFHVFKSLKVFYTRIYDKATYKCKAGGFNMRLDKDPGDEWSKKFGVKCFDGEVPTWDAPDWPTCASSEFWFILLFCQISPVQIHTPVASTATSQLIGLRAKYQDTRKLSSNATLSLSCFFGF